MSEYFVPVGKLSTQARIARMLVRGVLRPAFAAADHPQIQRAVLSALKGASRLPPGTQIREERILGLRCEWIAPTPESMDGPKTILYLHGGGFVSGSADSHRELAARIAAGAKARVLLPEYRLAPETPFPGANDDCLGIYRWLLRRGVDAANIVIGGDSAGGCLTLMTLLSLRESEDALPAAAFMLSPVTDCITHDGESYTTRKAVDPWFSPAGLRKLLAHYAETSHPARAILAPLRMPLGGLPPLFVQCGDDELLLSDSVRLADRAREAGTPVELEVWERMWHVFPAFAGIMPEGRKAVEKIAGFVRGHLAC